MQKLVREAVEQAVKAALEEPIMELKRVAEDLKKQLEAEKETNKAQGVEIVSLKLAINDLQQGKRLKYLRVFGTSITDGESREVGADKAICRKVYEATGRAGTWWTPREEPSHLPWLSNS